MKDNDLSPGSVASVAGNFRDEISKIVSSKDYFGLYALRRFYWHLVPEEFQSRIPEFSELLNHPVIKQIEDRVSWLKSEVGRYVRMCKIPPYSEHTPEYDFYCASPIDDTIAKEKAAAVLSVAFGIIAKKFAEDEKDMLFQEFQIGQWSGIWISKNKIPLDLDRVRKSIDY